MMKEVGLYIPCFNAETTIALCLEAVLRQSYPLREVIVVDDGSTDRTREIVSGYPVKIITHGTNKGLAISRNEAIKNMNTDYIASVDADCVAEEEWLARSMASFDSPMVVGSGGKLEEVYQETAADAWRAVHMKQYWENEKIPPAFLFGSNTVFRRKALLEIGLYDESLGNNYEDVDISIKLKGLGYTLVYEPYACVRHLKRDNVCSVLNSFWQWQLTYHIRQGYYVNRENLMKKIDENIGLANRFLEEDVAQGRSQLAYLDYLLAFHHCLKDIDFFNFKHSGRYPYCAWSACVALVDFTLCYHLNKDRKAMPTLLTSPQAFLQNFIAFTILAGELLKNRFTTGEMHRMISKHLLSSAYDKEDKEFLTRISNLIELHREWAGILDKSHPYLDMVFLRNAHFYFKKWHDSLFSMRQDFIEIISNSLSQSDSFIKGGSVNENR